MIFNAASYTITVHTEEDDDGDILYVGQVEEFPNIKSFEDNYDEAYGLILDAIETLKELADKTQTEFPRPLKE